MRRDWNRRARANPKYYVALGSRKQSWDDFFDGAKEVLEGLHSELDRIGMSGTATRRALEIGCGPGRLMLPLSRRFDQIDGVDVSSEMIALAKKNLEHITNARTHLSTGTDLYPFRESAIDFVYSYAVFQHIPSAEVVREYVRETSRVLRAGGAARLQFNGLPKLSNGCCDTWLGSRFTAGDIAAMARDNHLLVIALEGENTQDMWATLVKREHVEAGADSNTISNRVSIREVVAQRHEPADRPSRTPQTLDLSLEGVPATTDLTAFTVRIGGKTARATQLDWPPTTGPRRLRVMIPKGLAPGDHLIEVFCGEMAHASKAVVRIDAINSPPPRIAAVSDGVFEGCGRTISSNIVKISLEHSEDPGALTVLINGREAERTFLYCSSPDVPRFEIYFKLPRTRLHGKVSLDCRIDGRSIGPCDVEVAKDSFWWVTLSHPFEMLQAFRRRRWLRKARRAASTNRS